MSYEELLYLAPYIISLILSLGVFIYAWQHRHVRGATSYSWFAGGQTLTILGFILELVSPDLRGKILWDKFQWLTDTFLVILPFLFFSIEFSEYRLRRPSVVWSVLFVFLGTFTVLLFTDNFHHLLYPNPSLSAAQPFPELKYDFTYIIYIYALFYLYGANIYGISLLIKRALQPQILYRLQYLTIIFGFLIPLVLSFFSLANIKIASQRDITPISLAIGNLIVAWGLFRYGLFDIVPIARERIVENINDP
ncbi:MAG: histidine kinase N-terminal 7TM domain-containing protein, partial [Chloroflexota bacterium]